MSAIVSTGQTMVMMRLGAFSFSIPTATYQSLNRRSEYLWAGQQRFGQQESLQFVGEASESLTLQGTIFPEYRGGFQQLNKMRTLAGNASPMSLIDGNGKAMGKWVIVSVDESQSIFAAFGAPRKMEFTLELKRFPETPILTAAVSAVASASSAATTETGFLAEVKNTATSVITTAAKAASTAIDTINGAIKTVQEAANEAVQTVGPVIAAGQQAISTATELYQTAQAVKESMGNINSLAGVSSAMNSVMSAASAASRTGSVASVLARSVGADLSLSAGNSEAGTAVTDLAAKAGSMAVNATSVYTQANSVVKSIESF